MKNVPRDTTLALVTGIFLMSLFVMPAVLVGDVRALWDGVRMLLQASEVGSPFAAYVLVVFMFSLPLVGLLLTVRAVRALISRRQAPVSR